MKQQIFTGLSLGIAALACTLNAAPDTNALQASKQAGAVIFNDDFNARELFTANWILKKKRNFRMDKSIFQKAKP